jgi:two-component system, chemotaxis family, chemotaxis protein CheY
MHILIVDDNKSMRTILRRSLFQGGFEDLTITEASNGIDALEKYHLQIPDLILSDWNMPEMDGLDLLQAIREQNKDVLFGFVTAQNNSKLRRNAQKHGAHFLLSKPFTPEMLNTTIHSIIS